MLRGLSGLVCPSRTSERGEEGDCVKEGGGEEGEREMERALGLLLCYSPRYTMALTFETWCLESVCYICLFTFFFGDLVPRICVLHLSFHIFLFETWCLESVCYIYSDFM